LRKESGKPRLELERWLDEEIIEAYADRILAIDMQVINKCSQMTAENKKKGRPLTVIDSLIASTALAYDLKLVTRNVKDFKGLVDYINPFD
jgi:predicted nucleic acid-binding protein